MLYHAEASQVYEVDGQQPLKHNHYPVRQREMRNEENKKRVREKGRERERKRRKEVGRRMKG